jgi:translation initiation factor 1
MPKNSQLVYSSEFGRVQTGPKKQSATAGGDGIVRVRREKKGRGGKTMTTISGVSLGHPELKALASELKRKCGSGGSVTEGVIEIQGDQVDRVIEELARKGHRVKRAGG